MLLGQIKLFASEMLPPDFYAVEDWRNARATAKPEWCAICFIGTAYYAHPTVLQKLKLAR